MIFNTVHSCGAFCKVDKYIFNMNKLNFGFRGFRASFLAHAWQASQESLGQDPSFSIAWKQQFCESYKKTMCCFEVKVSTLQCGLFFWPGTQ